MYGHVALFMDPGTTELSVRVASTVNTNATINAPALPLNQQTTVRVEAVGREVFVFYNSSLVAIKMVTGERISGNAKLYVSDPWYSPAKAKISTIQMTPISEFSSRPIADYSGPILTGVAYEKTYVPEDYAISFNITPFDISVGKCSIIHYTQDNTPRGRSPGRA